MQAYVAWWILAAVLVGVELTSGTFYLLLYGLAAAAAGVRPDAVCCPDLVCICIVCRQAEGFGCRAAKAYVGRVIKHFTGGIVDFNMVHRSSAACCCPLYGRLQGGTVGVFDAYLRISGAFFAPYLYARDRIRVARGHVHGKDDVSRSLGCRYGFLHRLVGNAASGGISYAGSQLLCLCPSALSFGT